MIGSTYDTQYEMEYEVEIELVEGTFEACVEHRGPDADAPCADCGWLSADHTAGLAVVIEVGRIAAPALRRAS